MKENFLYSCYVVKSGLSIFVYIDNNMWNNKIKNIIKQYIIIISNKPTLLLKYLPNIRFSWKVKITNLHIYFWLPLIENYGAGSSVCCKQMWQNNVRFVCRHWNISAKFEVHGFAGFCLLIIYVMFKLSRRKVKVGTAWLHDFIY